MRVDPNNDKEYLELIVKVVTGEASPMEKKILNYWLGDGAEHQQVYDEYRNTWRNLEKMHGIAEHKAEEWPSLVQETGMTNGDISWLPRPGATKWTRLWLATSLAVFFVTASFITFYPFESQKTYVTASNVIAEVRLQDGSKVTLNTNSELAYPKKSSRSGRVARLTGEAYFEVAPDATRPFIISTGPVDIRASGGSFNVRTDPTNNTVEVVVARGKVTLYLDGAPKDNIVLGTGEKGIYNQGSLLEQQNDDPDFAAWRLDKPDPDDQSSKHPAEGEPKAMSR